MRHRISGLGNEGEAVLAPEWAVGQGGGNNRHSLHRRSILQAILTQHTNVYSRSGNRILRVQTLERVMVTIAL